MTGVTMVKFYCECCNDHMCVEIEPLQIDKLNESWAWGDIVCSECHFVIATISADEAGVYGFVKTETSDPK